MIACIHQEDNENDGYYEKFSMAELISITMRIYYNMSVVRGITLHVLTFNVVSGSG